MAPTAVDSASGSTGPRASPQGILDAHRRRAVLRIVAKRRAEALASALAVWGGAGAGTGTLRARPALGHGHTSTVTMAHGEYLRGIFARWRLLVQGELLAARCEAILAHQRNLTARQSGAWWAVGGV